MLLPAPSAPSCLPTIHVRRDMARYWFANSQMVCSNSYIRYLKVEKRAGNEKPMSHRRFLELLCEKQCAPPPEQPSQHKAAKHATKKSVYLNASFMQSKPWERCRHSDIQDPQSETAMCQWCSFKAKLAKKKPTAAEWKQLCGGARKPKLKESGRRRAKVYCAGCCVHFCSLGCMREMHRHG